MSATRVKRHFLGDILKGARQAHGMSLEDVAREAGTTAGHASRVERGVASPSFKLVINMARAVSVDIRELDKMQREAKQVNEKLVEMFTGHMSAESLAEIQNMSVETKREIIRALSKEGLEGVEQTPRWAPSLNGDNIQPI